MNCVTDAVMQMTAKVKNASDKKLFVKFYNKIVKKLNFLIDISFL